jgi:hypothetical protein
LAPDEDEPDCAAAIDSSVYPPIWGNRTFRAKSGDSRMPGNAKYKPIEPAPGRYVAKHPPEVMGA